MWDILFELSKAEFFRLVQKLLIEVVGYSVARQLESMAADLKQSCDEVGD